MAFGKTRIKSGSTVDLSKIDPNETFGWKKEDGKAKTAENLARIAELQDVLHFEGKHSLLLVLQAMDTGGKDGTVKVIGGAMNPAGVRVVSFKAPTKEELANGFMWRIEKNMPTKPGEVVIYNRSQYEDVGVVRVHNIVPESVWRPRFDVIKKFEADATKPTKEIPGGVHVLKFFLHISKDEQWGRLMDRVNDPDKHYKLNEGDFKERAFWDDYMKAYSEAIEKTSTDDAPWFVIPANRKWLRDLVISQIVVDHLENLAMKYPPPEVDVKLLKAKYFPDGENELAAPKPAKKSVKDDFTPKNKPKPK